jgi:hypothetical protein
MDILDIPAILTRKARGRRLTSATNPMDGIIGFV